MQLKSFSINISKQQAENIANSQKKSLISRLFLLNKNIEDTLLHYVEVKIVCLKITYAHNWFQKKLLKSKEPVKSHIMKIIISGSTGSAALVNNVPETTNLDLTDENIIQYSDKSNNDFANIAKKLALRIVHRNTGGIPSIEIIDMESIFRPYWVVCFDKISENKKIRYFPIEADGYKFHGKF